MFGNWRIAWNQKKRNTLLLISAVVVILSGLLGLATGMFFYEQQQIYTSATTYWQPVDKYYQFLNEENLEEGLVTDFNQIDEESLAELEQLKNDYASLADSIANDLTQDEIPENEIVRSFYDSSRELLVREQIVTEESLRLINFKYCLQNVAAKQGELNAELEEVFKNLAKSKTTDETKKLLNKSVDITKQKTEFNQDSANCFSTFGETREASAQDHLKPLNDANSAYEKAVGKFLTGIDELAVKETEEALKAIKRSQVSPEDLEEFDTLVKTSLEDQYNLQLGERRLLENDYQLLRQSYLEIRLRTLFK